MLNLLLTPRIQLETETILVIEPKEPSVAEYEKIMKLTCFPVKITEECIVDIESCLLPAYGDPFLYTQDAYNGVNCYYDL